MDDFDTYAFGSMGELQAIFGIIVANQEAWSFTEGCCLAHLLGEPFIGRVSGHTNMDHTAASGGQSGKTETSAGKINRRSGQNHTPRYRAHGSSETWPRLAREAAVVSFAEPAACAVESF